jgi:hypothetical protein
MEYVSVGQTLYGGYLLALNLPNQDQAGVDRLPLKKDGATTTIAVATTFLDPC